MTQPRSAPDAGRPAHRRRASPTQAVFERILADVKAEIDAGVQFALAAPYPRAAARWTRMSMPSDAGSGHERAGADVRRGGPRGDRGGDAARSRASSSSARTWPRPAIPSRCCSGWSQEFGTDRIIDTPISEPGYAGIGVGAAMTGMRPIVDIMFGDFITLDHGPDGQPGRQGRTTCRAARSRCPIVFRTTLGATRRSAAQHSQSLHAWVSHVPGLKVALPSTPYDAKGLHEDGHPRRQPGGHLRGQDDVPGEGPGARRGLHDPVRRGGRQARGHGHHHRRHQQHGAGGARRRQAARGDRASAPR